LKLVGLLRGAEDYLAGAAQLACERITVDYPACTVLIERT
jgi:hypothetical protein